MEPTDPTPHSDPFDDDWREPDLEPGPSSPEVAPERGPELPDSVGDSPAQSEPYRAEPAPPPPGAPDPATTGTVEPVSGELQGGETPSTAAEFAAGEPMTGATDSSWGQPAGGEAAAPSAPIDWTAEANPPSKTAPAAAQLGDDELGDAEFAEAADKFFDGPPTAQNKARTPLQLVALAVGVLALIAAVGFVGSLIVSGDDPDPEIATDSNDADAGAEDSEATGEADLDTDTGLASEDADDGEADSDEDLPEPDGETDDDDDIGVDGNEIGEFESVLGVAPEGRGWEFQAAPGQVPAGVDGPEVEVTPEDDVPAMVANAPANAVFRFAPGVYQDVQLVPRNGDSFLGFGQATLDGSNAGEGSAAFTGAAQDVFISGFEVRNYGNVSQNGAINAQIGGSDNPPAEQRSLRWVLEDLNVHNNFGVGINIGPFGQVRRVKMHSNGQLGITSHGGRGIVVEDCEINNNNTREVDPGFEGGGSKFKYTFDLVVRNCYFHDNFGYGLWTDIDNFNTLFEDNLIENETWSCISHEVSFDAVIRNNTVRNCGLDGDPWLWKAGIQVANSPDVVVEGNIIENSYNGIGLIEQNRGNPLWVLENVIVRNNTIVDSGQSGVVIDTTDADGNPTEVDETVVFEGNTWDAGLPDFEDELVLEADTVRSRSTADFRWGTVQSDWQGWQNLGLDAAGSFVDR